MKNYTCDDCEGIMSICSCLSEEEKTEYIDKYKPKTQ